MNEYKFKSKYKKNVCLDCPKRIPCASADSICDLISPCQVCEIKDICTSLCDQMGGYLNRGKTKTVKTVSIENERLESLYSFKVAQRKQEKTIVREKFSFIDIPWDVISKRDKEIVQKHFIEDKSYEDIAKEFNLGSQATVYEIIHGTGDKHSRGALRKLQEFAEYRRLLRKYGRFLSTSVYNTLTSYYTNCFSIEETRIADESYKQAYNRFLKAKKLIDKFKGVERD